MNAPKPTATGTLQKTPVSNLLVYGLDRGLDGTLVIEHAGARSAVRFTAGTAVKVHLPEPADLIGDLLVETAGVSVEGRDRVLARAAALGELTGRTAVSEGVAVADDVEAALAEQVARRLEALAALPGDAVYGYYGGQDFLASYGAPEGAPRTDALTTIWRVVRRHASDAAVDAAVARFAGRPLKLHRQARPARFGFDASERAVIDLLRAKPYDVDGVVGTGVLEPRAIRRVLYVLALSRHLDLGAGALPLGVEVVDGPPSSAEGSPRPRAVARAPTGQAPTRRTGPRPPGAESPSPSPVVVGDPAELTPEQEAFRDEGRRRAETIGGQNYYEILGVDPKADAGAIRSAFFQLAKQWHPDRIPSALADFKETASRVFARMTEAHQVLSSEEQRREYDELMKDGGGTADEQEQVQKILRAATAFQKAEVFARKASWDAAEREARLACEGDPEQPEYLAFHADLLSRQPGRTSFDDVVQMVNTAKKMQENNLRVRLCRARVLQRSGNARGAFQEFQFVAEADPRSVEAAREVRLYRMRQGQAAEEKKGGIANQDIGELFGRFFKR